MVSRSERGRFPKVLLSGFFTFATLCCLWSWYYMIFHTASCTVECPMLEGKTRIIMPPRGGKTGILYIPADIVKDSSFPFEANEKVLVRIEGRKLIVESDGEI